MSGDPPAWLPRHGDVRGDPHRGHRVDVIHAAVVVFADGSEGLASEPTGRVTLVTSDPKMLEMMEQALTRLAPPPGGRFEWRRYGKL